MKSGAYPELRLVGGGALLRRFDLRRFAGLSSLQDLVSDPAANYRGLWPRELPGVLSDGLLASDTCGFAYR